MIPSNETQVVIRLRKGEMVHCLNCKTGVYIPGGKKSPVDISQCHCFVCNNCKDRINLN